MGQYIETPTRKFVASTAIAIHLRVKLNGSNKLAVCGAGATENEVGTMTRAALADGDIIAVRLPTAPGTSKMVALTSFSREALVYAAAGGYVDDVVNGKPIGIALEAATAVGDIVEVMRVNATVVVSTATALDDVDITWGTGSDAVARFSTGDTTPTHAFVLGLDDTSQLLHITDKAAVASDWQLAAVTHPTIILHSNTTPVTDYLAIGNHDGTTATIDVVGGTTLALDIAGTTALNVTAAAVTVTGALVVTGNDLPTTAGIGITGTADNFASSVTKHGTLFKTTIVVDLDGLNSGGTAHDIIGADGAGVAHLGQITAARNGTIFAGTLTCIEAPTGGDPDVDLWDAIEATGVEDTGIAALTGEHQLCNGGDLSAGTVVPLTVYPVANQYLYLTTEEVTDATYTAGIIVIELWGK